MLFLLLCTYIIRLSICEISENSFQKAQVNVSYLSLNGEYVIEHSIGWYGVESKIGNAKGRLILALSIDDKTDGCSRIVNMVAETWVALIKRNSCKFQDKIYNAVVINNASAVIIYNSENSSVLVAMKHQVKDVVAIFVSFNFGHLMSKLLLNNSFVQVNIMPVDYGLREASVDHHWLTSRTSVLFVSISFIVLIAVSLCWLAIYYVQRFRYVSSKHVSKRLMNAAWRAIQSMEQKSIRSGDAELTGDKNVCAICVENYQVAETIRILPCKHKFHKSCVDMWLLEQRRCPMCQTDILHHSQANKKKKSLSSYSRENQSLQYSHLPLVANPNTVEASSSHWPININETKTLHAHWSRISNPEDSDSMEDWTENSNSEIKPCDPSMSTFNIKERAKIMKSNWLLEKRNIDSHVYVKRINESMDANKFLGNNVKVGSICNNTNVNKMKKRCSSESDYSPTGSSANSNRKISDLSGNSEF